jgi:hypothetical protein
MSLVLSLRMMRIIQSVNLFAGKRRKGPGQAVLIVTMNVIVIVSRIMIVIMIVMQIYALMQ